MSVVIVTTELIITFTTELTFTMGTLEFGLLKCDCGMPARSLCGTQKGCTLVQCLLPVCGLDGGHCKSHRHKPGTMGYPRWKSSGIIDWQGYEADEPGWWPALKALCFVLFASKKEIAQRAWDDVRKQFQPPAPLPPFTLRIGKRYFEGCLEHVHEIFGMGEEKNGER